MWIDVPICLMIVPDATEDSMKPPDVTSLSLFTAAMTLWFLDQLMTVCIHVAMDYIVLVDVLHQVGVVLGQRQACEFVDRVVPDERVQRYENIELHREAEYFNSRHAADEVGM